MASAIGGGSLNSNERPVVVRVKRKASQSPLDAFWLEINERPLKRTLLDFGKLSISESSSTIVEELKTKKVLLCHVETVTSSEVTLDVLQSAVKHDQLLAKAKQSQESASKNARFKQIWRSRNSKEEATHDEPFHDICQFFDVVRVDSEEKNREVLNDHNRDSELEDHKLMSQYLPLLKEFIPSAAVEIESDIHDYISTRAPSDGFVYDIYAVKDEMNISEEDVAQTLPLVQVDAEDDFYDGPDVSDYESDDSNAENNPLNDYPDEESSEENTEDDTSSGNQSGSECRSSDDESDGAENSIHQFSQSEDDGEHDWLDDDYLYSDDEELR